MLTEFSEYTDHLLHRPICPKIMKEKEVNVGSVPTECEKQFLTVIYMRALPLDTGLSA